MEKHTFSKDELIEEVKKESEIGKQIVEIEMNYLRVLADGSLLKEINGVCEVKSHEHRLAEG